ncbi:MAG TPA: S49 family peptidase, partial [Gemmatimonadales bacterium]|nr:S49 family peptidase [Gemmatimonadales bacterium]
AASGGYYISAPADEIWAHPATITGSIGIFAEVPNINRTLAKFGVGVDGLRTTQLDGMTQRVEVPLTDAARTVIQAGVDDGYRQFVERVANGRRKTPAQIDEIGQGRVWAAVDAQSHGLVDHLGSFGDAVQAAAKRAHISDYKLQFIEPELSWAQSLAMSVKVRAVQALASTGLADLTGTPLGNLTQLADGTPLAREAQRLSQLKHSGRLSAYCFCTAQ